MYSIELTYNWQGKNKLYHLCIEQIPNGIIDVKESSYSLDYLYSILDDFGLDYPEQIPFKN
jgi:hypothetical protein